MVRVLLKSFVRLFSPFLILLCLACQSPPAETPTAAIPNDKSVTKVQAAVSEGLQRLLARLTVKPELVWQSVPYQSGERLVILELKHGPNKSRGEWRVSENQIIADSQFARALEALPENPSELELTSLVPASWLDSGNSEPVVESTPSPTPEPPQATPTPEPVAVASPSPVPKPSKTPKPPKPKLALVGVMAGDINTAFFQLGDRRFSAKPGQTVSGVTVHSIAPQRVNITFRGKRRELYVSMPLEAQLKSPKPRPEEPETVYLDNSSLDKTPPTVLPNGVRKL